MPQPTTRAALIQYTSDFPATIPNLVIFQFNPEQLTRSIQIPERPTGPNAVEVTQAGDPPTETISFTARFDASDRLALDHPQVRAAGIGPELAALQQMAHPTGTLVGLLGEAVDAIGSMVSPPGESSIPIPRESYPRVLFIWGVYRVLPVVITQLSITETKFDFLLNPTQADVQMTLSVITPSRCSDDPLMIGAAAYSSSARELLAMTNIPANIAETVIDIAALVGV
ncbi:MAG TPA: hypothetical protein VIV11_40740 [Kofleriaceae bacterium]